MPDAGRASGLSPGPWDSESRGFLLRQAEGRVTVCDHEAAQARQAVQQLQGEPAGMPGTGTAQSPAPEGADNLDLSRAKTPRVS
jgi:hypothetical protein